jgi:hypothetical protein
MNLADDHARAALRARLGELFTDRLVICGIAPLAGFTDWVALLQAAGARRPLIVASGPGAGPVPAPEAAQVLFVDAPQAGSMTEELRLQDGFVRNLPADARAAIEEYDPRREAIWLTGPFVNREPVLGRPVVGGRPQAWTALEDKLIADRIWESVGAAHAPYLLARCDAAALAAAHADLDQGAGTVWAGDARDGFNGGGDFVRWVGDDADAAAALEFFTPRCDRVRVMPFLDGVPCSIHGFVLPDDTAAFRPVELAILRGPGRRFVYGGQGTSWDPPTLERAAMRDLVRRTGEHLRTTVGYRGAFGIDGILTVDGFRPTELNARLSGGLSSLARAVDPALFWLLQFNASAGRDVGVTAADLERWAVPAMDAHPFCKAIAVSDRRVAADPFDVPVCWDGERLTRSDVPTGWTVSVGPNPAGTYCKLTTTAAPVPGQRAAELNAALMRFLDAELGTGFGEVRAAPAAQLSAR